jgi:hydroxymethylbilane synthase
VRIGTRGSALALVQAGAVSNALGPGHELVVITTHGDRERAAADKAKWVRELDAALLAGEVDLAVHSAKDVPAQLPDGIVIAAVPLRAPAVDALCGAPSLAALPAGARVGTASVRRAAQLRALRDDLAVSELRGNVDTRLGRLHDGDFDAIVLALAGLERLGRDDEATGTLPELVPCAGQGALIVAARSGDAGAIAAAAAIDDAATHAAVRAERELVRGLEADCDTPVGAHAVRDGAALTITAFAGRLDGSAWVRDTLTRSDGAGDPEALGRQAAERLLSAGAREVLAG